jgi:hypothetical protein
MAVTVLRLRLVTYTVPEANPCGAADAVVALRNIANAGVNRTTASVAKENFRRRRRRSYTSANLVTIVLRSL